MKLFILTGYICSLAFLGKLAKKPEYAEFDVLYSDKWSRPYVEVEVEGRKFLELFDLGADCEFAFTRSALAMIYNKEPFRKGSFGGFNKNAEEMLQYLVPQINVDGLIFEHAIVHEIDEKFAPTGCQCAGFIGNGILQKGNLLLDFPSSKIRLYQDFSKNSLIKNKNSIDTWFKIGFHRKEVGIAVMINTDIGELVFLLDTGATHTIIDQSLLKNRPVETFDSKTVEYQSSKFKIGDFDFGQQKLLGTQWEKFADEQGILGMDFLKKHVIYIDYPNKVLYIKP